MTGADSPPTNYSPTMPKYFPILHAITQEILENFKLMDTTLPALSCEIESLKVTLPPSTKKKVLLINLEGTLIHSLIPDFNYSKNGINLKPPDFHISEKDLFVIIRPYAVEFLSTLAAMYQIIVF